MKINNNILYFIYKIIIKKNYSKYGPKESKK